MDKGLITICMPVYNGEAYIKEAIIGVLKQTYTNFELIIIDDGSTDNTFSLIGDFVDSRIRYVKNETNLGLIYTRNLGISLAKGEFLAFNDCDDISMPERLITQLEFFKKNPDIGMCGGAAYLINEKSEVIDNIEVITGDNKYLNSLLLFSNIFLNSSLMFRASVLGQNRYRLPLSEDYDYTVNLSSLGIKIANLSEAIVMYRIHDNNISTARAAELKINVFLILRQQLTQFDYNPKEEDLELHYCFLNGDFGRYQSNQIISWLLKLNDLNRKSQIYDNYFFDKTLLLQFHKYVKFKKNPLIYFMIFTSVVFIKTLFQVVRSKIKI